MATKPVKSTALATKKSTSVVSIQEQLKAMAAATANQVAPASGISIRVSQSKEFQLPDGQRTRDPIHLVIVDFVSRNNYYTSAYSKDEVSPPACFAIGSNPQTLIPSENSPEKQCGSCAACPMNQFGSAGAGKACKNERVLAVLPAYATEESPLWLLKVSPTAIKGFDAFIRTVGTSLQLPPVGVICTVGFDPNKDFPSLVFGDPQPNKNVGMHIGRVEEARKLLATEPDVSQCKAAEKPVRKAATARR